MSTRHMVKSSHIRLMNKLKMINKSQMFALLALMQSAKPISYRQINYVGHMTDARKRFSELESKGIIEFIPHNAPEMTYDFSNNPLPAAEEDLRGVLPIRVRRECNRKVFSDLRGEYCNVNFYQLDQRFRG